MRPISVVVTGNPIFSTANPPTVGPKKAPKAKADWKRPETHPYVWNESSKPASLNNFHIKN